MCVWGTWGSVWCLAWLGKSGGFVRVVIVVVVVWGGGLCLVVCVWLFVFLVVLWWWVGWGEFVFWVYRGSRSGFGRSVPTGLL